ncbi:MAG TPA: (2Fe-2S) ferredoxin domain-containing protein [Clostridiales bacterium]|nr:(2Fe-2S) ferredoxin domain-containing protein [Clostridiales bacterium]
MERTKNYEEFKHLSTSLKKEKESLSSKVVVKIAMATCSIASGAGPVLALFKERMPKLPKDSLVVQTGCLGLCHSEPTVEVTMPGCEPVVFGKVDVKRAESIIEDYVMKGEKLDFIIEGNQ